MIYFIYLYLLSLPLSLCIVFCMYYCYHGLFGKRPFEMFGYSITTFIILYYVIINYFIEGDQGDVNQLVRTWWAS